MSEGLLKRAECREICAQQHSMLANVSVPSSQAQGLTSPSDAALSALGASPYLGCVLENTPFQITVEHPHADCLGARFCDSRRVHRWIGRMYHSKYSLVLMASSIVFGVIALLMPAQIWASVLSLLISQCINVSTWSLLHLSILSLVIHRFEFLFVGSYLLLVAGAWISYCPDGRVFVIIATVFGPLFTSLFYDARPTMLLNTRLPLTPDNEHLPLSASEYTRDRHYHSRPFFLFSISLSFCVGSMLMIFFDVLPDCRLLTLRVWNVDFTNRQLVLSGMANYFLFGFKNLWLLWFHSEYMYLVQSANQIRFVHRDRRAVLAGPPPQTRSPIVDRSDSGSRSSSKSQSTSSKPPHYHHPLHHTHTPLDLPEISFGASEHEAGVVATDGQLSTALSSALPSSSSSATVGQQTGVPWIMIEAAPFVTPIDFQKCIACRTYPPALARLTLRLYNSVWTPICNCLLFPIYILVFGDFEAGFLRQYGCVLVVVLTLLASFPTVSFYNFAILRMIISNFQFWYYVCAGWMAIAASFTLMDANRFVIWCCGIGIFGTIMALFDARPAFDVVHEFGYFLRPKLALVQYLSFSAVILSFLVFGFMPDVTVHPVSFWYVSFSDRQLFVSGVFFMLLFLLKCAIKTLTSRNLYLVSGKVRVTFPNEQPVKLPDPQLLAEPALPWALSAP